MVACSKPLAASLLILLLAAAAWAQPAPAPEAAPGQAPPAPAARIFSQPELEQMLAPIALYPDALLAQILMAATHPVDIVQAARWSKVNPGLSGQAAVTAAEPNSWDASVKALVAFPQVLAMLDEKLDWTERLGEAFLGQQAQVMDTVQGLRAKAQAAGSLKSDEHISVQGPGSAVAVQPASPDVMYVPYYDPNYAYGAWGSPGYPPVTWAPWPGYGYYGPGYPGLYWGPAIFVGAGFLYGGFDWPHRYLYFHGRRYFHGGRPRRYYGRPGERHFGEGRRR
ncbi:MAG TPA: DUF3300 domain-containing protein [bacterium]|nr:DUF3300 domain-containing protein [bacterium]